VVGRANASEVGQLGWATVGEVDAPVVDLQAAGNHAAGDDTDRVPLDEGGPKTCGDGAPSARDRPNVDAVDDQDAQEAVAEQVPGGGDWHGSDALDLTDLVTVDGAAA
jgi:hypothetical protein